MPLSYSARCCSLRHRAGSPRADTTTVRAQPSRERVVDPDRAAGFADRASIPIRASRVRPPPPRRARRCPSRAQPAAAPCVTAPAHQEPTRRPRERRRAASESSFLIAPPASPSVRRSQSAPHARGRRRRAVRADAPLVLSPLLFLASPRRLTVSRHADCASAAKPRDQECHLRDQESHQVTADQRKEETQRHVVTKTNMATLVTALVHETKCPLRQGLSVDPSTADDGTVYDHVELCKLDKSTDAGTPVLSPLTRELIRSPPSHPSPALHNIVDLLAPHLPKDKR